MSFSTHYTRITWITLRVCKVVQVEKADVGLKRFKISSLRGKNVVINQEKKVWHGEDTGRGQRKSLGKIGKVGRERLHLSRFCSGFWPVQSITAGAIKKKERSCHWRFEVPFWTSYKGSSSWDSFFLFFLFFRRKLCLWNPAVQMNGNKKRNGPHSPTSSVKLQTHFARFALKLITNLQTRLVKFSAAMSQNTSWCASSIHKNNNNKQTKLHSTFSQVAHCQLCLRLKSDFKDRERRQCDEAAWGMKVPSPASWA